MLETLRIKNLALVEDLSWDLSNALNIITGETGAGKSVIIGALDLILGERSDKSLIRTGADTCTVEALFQLSPALVEQFAPRLEENGLEACDDGQLIIKRILSISSTGKQFVNGSPTNLQTLKNITRGLVDMHGPHDHQSLFSVDEQLSILDKFAGLGQARAQFSLGYRSWRKLLDERDSLVINEREAKQQLDLWSFQLSEIDSAQLNPAQDGDDLENRYKRSANSKKLAEHIQSAQTILTLGESNLLESLNQLQRHLQDIASLDASAQPLVDANDRGFNELQTLISDLEDYADSLEVDPAEFNRISERISLIQTLKRKYGANIPEILDFARNTRAKLDSLESRDEQMAQFTKQIAALEKNLEVEAGRLNQQRRVAAPKLAKQIAQELGSLGFKQSQFSIDLKSNPGFTATGKDSVEFLFAPNPGEPAKPLREIASNGEISRVMLAIKGVLAEEDSVP
ncbi:MAG: DNA repair protein RecN, partial [Verrucomicrobiota bacterium]|nr:DNA repair protein RecN [Verrucomicrobiota bacterium]